MNAATNTMATTSATSAALIRRQASTGNCGNGALRARGPHANERRHRPQFEREHDSKQRELQPEEAVALVEARFLSTEEHASEPGRDPQCGGDTPDVVGGEQPAPGRV